jgi:hypothetical protein
VSRIEMPKLAAMPSPQELPAVDSTAHYAWLEGIRQGIALGIVLGAAFAVVLLKA